jgi:hypothetical protein
MYILRLAGGNLLLVAALWDASAPDKSIKVAVGWLHLFVCCFLRYE